FVRRRLAHNGPTFSGVGASGNPGAVQSVQVDVPDALRSLPGPGSITRPNPTSSTACRASALSTLLNATHGSRSADFEFRRKNGFHSRPVLPYVTEDITRTRTELTPSPQLI
ncbi:hypothetical protein, partial [Bradyrhizobium sp. Mp19]|uniref:hypothetical protein n=1 Tax=Bradyrhizobium sp. Mp19 TaxID=3042156 RepID=UPI002485FDF9